MPPRHNIDQGLQQYADGLWGVDCYRRGRRVRLKVGSKQQARQVYQEIRRREKLGDLLPEEAAPRRTLADLVDAFLAVTTNRDSRRYAAEWKAAIGDRLPEELSIQHVREAIVMMTQAGLSAGTVHRKLSALAATYAIAVRDGDIQLAQSPFRDRRALRMPKQSPKVEVFLTEEQEARLLAALGEVWGRYVEFSVLTSMRWGNQVGLRREDVDLERGFIMLPMTKSGKRHTILLSERCAEVVREQLASHRSPWLWPSKRGMKLNRGNFGDQVWLPALRQAGITGFSWHGLRHTAASRMMRAGIPLYTVSKVLGHSDTRMTERYSHLGNADLQRAMEVLAGIRETPATEKL